MEEQLEEMKRMMKEKDLQIEKLIMQQQKKNQRSPSPN